jgi:hypothetical protein
MSRAVLAHHWSALRLSQPLSGFRIDRVPRPCFVPQPFLDCLPSECSPREGRVPLSGPLTPLQLFTVLRNAPPATLSLTVSPTPTLLTQLPGFPASYGFPFHESEGPLPGCPGSPTEGSPLPPASSASKLFPSSSPFALTWVAPSLVVVTLLALCPSRDQTAQISDPRTRLDPCRPKLEPSPEGSDPQPQGPSRPLDSRVKPPQNINALAKLRRQSPVLFRTGPYRLSAVTPSPLTFQLTVTRQPWPSELLSTWEVDSSPKRSVDLVWGFVPPRATSKLRSPADPGTCFCREHRYVSPRTQRTL